MLSLEIHVKIVLKVLQFSINKVTTPLKTNSLQLLIDKITTFRQGFLSTASTSLIAIFTELLELSIALLETFLTALEKKKGKSSESNADLC